MDINYDLQGNSLLVILFKNELGLIYLQTSIGIVSIQLDGFNHFYLTQIILFNINHLFTDSEVITHIAILH